MASSNQTKVGKTSLEEIRPMSICKLDSSRKGSSRGPPSTSRLNVPRVLQIRLKSRAMKIEPVEKGEERQMGKPYVDRLRCMQYAGRGSARLSSEQNRTEHRGAAQHSTAANLCSGPTNGRANTP
ncbi:hypothetical protein POVWA2_031700 [Plasmodium ovale wallikeri]|uniref:Uncharacterized protein n=1 Tax=Plasmodium ovale wallikeri TaxID=864142 RepID=A0A1A8YYQ4_PLAOA|nr:hypothetical protein POVWA1_031980 [Plasmodium ovale wallikeri]SBT36738.1 hypothetical protein POVWA2_031700 [Plasmodium ovale wallikeri]